MKFVTTALLLIALAVPGYAESRSDAAAHEKRQADPSSQRVAFFARFSSATVDAPARGPYVFNQALFNEGNGYNTRTGIFTAPHPGTYMFTLQLFTDGTVEEHPFADIRVNGDTRVRMAFDNSGGNPRLDNHKEVSESTTVPIQLQRGDRVWVETLEGASYHYWGTFHSFFSGVLVRPSH